MCRLSELCTDRIYRFADKFRQRKFMERCFDILSEKPDRKIFDSGSNPLMTQKNLSPLP